MAGVVVGIAVVLGGGVYAFAQYQANQAMEAIRTQVTTHIEGSTLTNGEVRANVFEGSMTVRDLVFYIPDSKETVTITEMLLDGNEEELATAVFKDIRAKDVEDRKVGGIDRIVVSNLMLKQLQLPVSTSREAMRSFLQNLTVGGFVVESVNFDHGEVVVSLGKLRIEGMKKGLADIVSYADASIETVSSGNEATISVKSFIAEQVNLNMFDFYRGKEEKLTGEKGFAKSLMTTKFGPISVDGLNLDTKDVKLSAGKILSSAGGAGKIGKFAMKDVEFDGRGNQKNQKFSIKNVEIEALDFSAYAGSIPDLQNAGSDQFLEDFWRTAKIEKFLLENFKVIDGEVSPSIGKFLIKDVKDGIAGNITLTDMSVSNIDNDTLQSMSIKQFKIDNLDMMIAKKSEAELLVALQNFMGIDAGVISGLQVNMKDGTKVSIKKIGVEGIERHQGVVTAVEMVLQETEFPVDAFDQHNPEVAAFLKGFSEDVFNVSFDIALKYDVATGSIVEDMGLSAKGMGTLKIDLELAGFDLETFQLFSQGAFESVDWLNREDLKLVGFTVRYTDEKLADWLIDTYSNGNRVGLAEHLAANVSSFSADRMFIQLASEEIKRFITGANQFLITAKPVSPVTAGAVMRAMDQGAISNILNLQLSGQ